MGGDQTNTDIHFQLESNSFMANIDHLSNRGVSLTTVLTWEPTCLDGILNKESVLAMSILAVTVQSLNP